MSWSTELWDQFDNVSKHTAKGIEYLDKLGQFMKDRCAVEADYASNMRKLVKNYDVLSNFSSKKKNCDSDKDFTYCKAFTLMLKELSDIAGQHEVIAEALSTQIVKEINTINKKLREERKKYLNEAVEYQQSLNNSLNQLDKSKRLYDKAFRESEKANDNYAKADKDLNLSRADLEKAKTNALNKERACEDCKSSYARQLQLVNQAQREHYSQSMPKIFQQLQELEAKRIESFENFMKLSAMIQKDTNPIINSCLDGIVEASKTIDPAYDAQLVIDRYKSGMQPPDDIPFEDLSAKTNGDTESTLSKGNSLVHSQPSKSDYLRHTFSARGLKKRTLLLNIFGGHKNDYSDLPPNQKRKKLLAKLEQLKTQISQVSNEKDGLIIMRQAYEENGKFGDPKTIESQLKETELHLIKLASELKKHQTLLEELEVVAPSNDKRTSVSTGEPESLSNSPSLNSTRSQLYSTASASAMMMNNQQASTIATGKPHLSSELSRTNSDNSIHSDSINRGDEAVKSTATNRTSNSFIDSYSDSALNSEAQDCTDGLVLNDKSSINNQDNNGPQNSSDTYDAPADLPSQAEARAKYPFKDGPLGSIPMKENEIFDVIEFDHGDGWTRVRRKVFNVDDNDFIGFVPTSYIDIDLNC